MQKKKKLLFFINSLTAGGAERVVSILIKQLASDYEIELLLLEDKVQYTLPDGLDYSLLPNRNRNDWSKISSIYFQARAFKQYCKDHEIAYCFSFLNRANWIAGLSKKLGNATFICLNERTCTAQYLKQLQGAARWVSKFLFYFLYPLADKVLCNSKYAMADMQKLLPIDRKKLGCIYNPVDLFFIENKLSTSIPAPAPSSYIIHVGNFRPEKNHALLLHAFAGVKQKNIFLQLMGQGHHEEEVRRKAQQLNLLSRIIWTPFKENPFVDMKGAQLLVLCSQFEGFPNVILEALACGVPVISTDCYSGPREILAPDTDPREITKHDIVYAAYGVLVPNNNAQLLTKAIDELLENESLRSQYSRLGKERIKAFSAPLIASKYKRLINLHKSL